MNFPQLQTDQTNGPRAMIHTSMGDVEVQLFPEQAPKAVENFVTLAKQQYYDEVIFHRVISDFMIQGGDPTGTGMGGDSIWGEPFEDEFSKELYNLRGALSMANSGPNTNGSQFFIVQNQHMSAQLTEQMSEAKFPEEIVTAYQKVEPLGSILDTPYLVRLFLEWMLWTRWRRLKRMLLINHLKTLLLSRLQLLTKVSFTLKLNEESGQSDRIPFFCLLFIQYK